MRLTGNKNYRVLLSNGSIVKFKFLGNKFNSDDLFIEVNGIQQSLFELLRHGYLAYEEID